VVEKSGKALQIIAGPGAGKTTKLVEQISFALNKDGGENSAIVACTFTRKAAEELSQRIDQKVGAGRLSDGKLLIGTIHSISLSILREFVPEEYLDWDVISEESQVPYVHSKLSMFGFDDAETRGQASWDQAREISRIFLTLTDENIDVEELLAAPATKTGLDRDTTDQIHRVLENYHLYRAALTEDKLFDFATIQRTLSDLLQSDQKVARLVVQRYRTIFVDEYQDVNDVQNDIFLRLCELGASLTIVGDDDQSIYGFRGGKVEHLVGFGEQIKAIGSVAEIIRLEVNYRSTPEIVSATNAYINGQTYERLPKSLTADRSVHGPAIRAIQFDADLDEANWIVDEIVCLRTSGTITSFRSVGVLFTSVKSHAGVLLERLKVKGVPVQVSGSGTLLEQSFVEEFMGLLGYWLEKDATRGDREALLVERLDDKTRVEYLNSKYFDNLFNLLDSKRYYGSCLALMYDIFDATNFVGRHQDHGVNLGTLTTLVHTFDGFSGKYNPFGLYSYLTFLRKQHDIDYVDDESRDAVQVLTVHRSKGLQFDVVFVVSQNERNRPISTLFDHFSNMAGRVARDVDESKRVLYVAMTRARNFLAITSSISLKGRLKCYGWNGASLDAIASGIQNSELSVVHLPSREFTDFSKVVGLNRVLSYNAIRLYEICPLQYRFSHVDRLETVRIGGMQFGVNMHRIVEQLLRKRKAGVSISDEMIGPLIDKFWRDLPTRPNDENVKFRESGQKQLKMFVAKYLNDLSPDQIAGVEQPFSLTISDTKIIGRFDLRVKSGANDEIVDFKTGDEDDYRGQLNFYAACWSRMTNEAVKQVAVYYLKSGRLEVFVPEDVDGQIARVNDVVHSIKSGHFQANPGKHCGDCAYSAICEFSTTSKKKKSFKR
jgi:DNA helicase-2/ATP-dependent DNA helicase PcrA